MSSLRVAFEARGLYRKEFVDYLSSIVPRYPKILHFGDKHSHYDLTGLVRNRHLPGTLGYLLDGPHPDLSKMEYLEDQFYDKYFAVFADQLRRNSINFVRRGHKLDIRTDYYKFYRTVCDKFEEKLLAENVESVVFFEIPHLAIDYSLYIVSKKLGLRTLILSQKIPGKVFSMWNIEDFGNLNIKMQQIEADRDPATDVKLFYMDPKWQKKSPRGKFGPVQFCQLLKKLLLNQPRIIFTPGAFKSVVLRISRVKRTLPEWRDILKYDLSDKQIKYFEKLCEFEKAVPDIKQNYVYVPLHLQPEMTTSSLGGKFVDQALMIETLSQMLPEGWFLFIKENPKQSAYDRDEVFFDRINKLGNARWVPSDFDTQLLSSHAKVVATVSGVAGWEAIKVGTPALIFGVTWYLSMPGVFKFTDETDIEKIASFKIDPDFLTRSQKFLFSKTHEGNIDKIYFKHVMNFDKNKNVVDIGNVINGLLTGEIETTFMSSN